MHKNTNPNCGKFVISLDLELMWGVYEKRTISSYGDCILGGRAAIPKILALFKEFGIRATWATVGLLFFGTRKQLLDTLPSVLPAYEKRGLSPYSQINHIGENEDVDPYHFGGSLVSRILETTGQDVGTHTFSHYYCLEPGQTLEAFKADIDAAIGAAALYGLSLRTIVFPRNQWTDEHVEICSDRGITVFRGNPSASIYRPMNSSQLTPAIRALRLLDATVDTGVNTLHEVGQQSKPPYDVTASRFLRPSLGGIGIHDRLRLKRILSELERAAIERKMFHLWCHPHNFGRNTNKMLQSLRRILSTYRKLADNNGMVSMNMADFASGSFSKVSDSVKR